MDACSIASRPRGWVGRRLSLCAQDHEACLTSSDVDRRIINLGRGNLCRGFVGRHFME